ncbi:MAG: hypothetical protein P8Y66_03715 [Nitrospirota bacterium]|jgi:CRP-like cAMP-binding protein
MDKGEDLFGTVYGKGETVFEQGDPGETMFVVQSRAVAVTRLDGGRKTAPGFLSI